MGFFSKKQKKSFFDALNGKFYKGRSSKELKSYKQGKKIASTKDYILANKYTEHMNRKFGLLKSVYDNEGNYITTYVKRNKYGVAIGLNGKTLPSSYENYRDMQRDKEFKKEIYSQYDNKKGRY